MLLCCYVVFILLLGLLFYPTVVIRPGLCSSSVVLYVVMLGYVVTLLMLSRLVSFVLLLLGLGCVVLLLLFNQAWAILCYCF